MHAGMGLGVRALPGIPLLPLRSPRSAGAPRRPAASSAVLLAQMAFCGTDWYPPAAG